MTIYHVHIYRVMRLRFDNVQASDARHAAAKGRDLSLKAANAFDECDGETFSALVDVA